MIVFACARLDHLPGVSATVPYATRQHWGRLIRSDGLEMHYQPILNLKTGRIMKVEALARLRDGEHTILPGHFLPALSSDDFFEIYARGLDQALTQYKRWLDVGLDFRVAINLPSRALADRRYLEATREALGRSVCPAHKLEVEILETDALPPNVDVAAMLERFKALGVSLAEDDLGSGHSSLTRLRQLPFDTIKIDRDIVSSASEDPTQALRFIYQLTRLGHTLGKIVVVEGVEDMAMLEAIMVLGSDAVQGYVIAKPMPAAELTAWAQANTPLALPSTQPIASRPAKLAGLLLWEERIYLTLSGGPVSAAPDDRVLRLPFKAEASLQQALASAAVQYGLRSIEYLDARQRLLDSF